MPGVSQNPSSKAGECGAGMLGPAKPEKLLPSAVAPGRQPREEGSRGHTPQK